MDSNSLEQLAQLELRYKKFSLVGTGNVQAAGSLKTGFAINVGRFGGVGSNVPGGGEPPPPPDPATGACCDEDGSCTVTTFGDCTGTWKGPSTVCDPNPCPTPMPPCNGCAGFDALDGSCRKFLTKTYTVSHTANYSIGATGETCSLTINYTRVSTYDADTCELSVDCSGFYTFDFHPAVGPDVHHEGDPCAGVVGGCGICPGDCPRYLPSEAEATCGDTGCSCSATELTCSISHTQNPFCDPTLTGSCSTDVSLILSDECIQGTGACCNYDSSTCDIQTECDCNNSGGSYSGDDTVCDPDPCGFSGFLPPP